MSLLLLSTRSIFSCEDAAQQVLMSVCLYVRHQVEILLQNLTKNVPECSRKCIRMYQNVLECSSMHADLCMNLHEDCRSMSLHAVT